MVPETPAPAAPGGPVIRVDRGAPDPWELAALLTVLSRVRRTISTARPVPTTRAGWHRPERRTPYAAPGSWRD